MRGRVIIGTQNWTRGHRSDMNCKTVWVAAGLLMLIVQPASANDWLEIHLEHQRWDSLQQHQQRMLSSPEGKNGNQLPNPGDIVPPYKNGLVSSAGTCVGHPSREASCSLAYGTLQLAGGGTVGLYSGTAAGSGSDGLPLWQVLDTTAVPRIGSRQELLTGGLCKTAESSDAVVAIVGDELSGTMFKDIVWAVGLNPLTGVWTPENPKNVVCENPLP